MKANELIEKIKAASTSDEIRQVNLAISEFLPTADPSDADRVKEAQEEMIDRVIAETDVEIEEGLRFLALNGKKYNLEDWLTLAEYARKYELSTPNIVTNWIVRGIIPAEDIIEVPELNNLKLVRNRAYKKTSTEVGG